MPQASQNLRDRIRTRFDSIDCGAPLLYLKNGGWSEIGGYLSPPNGPITDAEWECLDFLCDEWDFAYNPVTK